MWHFIWNFATSDIDDEFGQLSRIAGALVIFSHALTVIFPDGDASNRIALMDQRSLQAPVPK